MRILITGSLNPFDLAASYQRAFAALGHDADIFDWYGPQERAAARVTHPVPRTALVASSRRLAVLDLLARVRRDKPRLILLLKTDDLPRGVVRGLRVLAPSSRIVAFHPDDPFNINGLRGPSHRRSVHQMRAVDHYFTWSDRLIERISGVGARAVDYLGFAWDPEVTRAVSVSAADRARFGADVSFAGTWDPKREAWLAPLAHARGVSLAIWGPDWKTKARDERVLAALRGEALRGDDLARAVLSSRASINVLRRQNETAENMRTYEIPGCGGTMLAERSAQQERIFREGVEALYVRDPEDLVARVRMLVSSQPEALAEIGAAALRRAAVHTYRERAERLLDLAMNALRFESQT